jgi:uncharacterized membrane protein YkoI
LIQLVAAAIVALLILGSTYPGQKEFGPHAKITIAKARAIATRAYPGKIINEELEREPGGSGLRFTFDIKHGAVMHEVGVDAISGKVLENVFENSG